jgi:ergothioneine biosynthesis protein EgtB
MDRERMAALPRSSGLLGNGTSDAASLAATYRAVRQQSEALCRPLAIEDYVIQSMPDASPVKWHLAHTSWFFETFVLTPLLQGYQAFHPDFGYLFNSYYQGVGPRWSRPQRGLLSRPTVAEVYSYRAHVDEQMQRLFQMPRQTLAQATATVVLGLNHEQQHQELIVTDLKHAWSANPLHPVYHQATQETGDPPPCNWVDFSEGLTAIGHDGMPGFTFDNELPRHKVFLQAFQLASRLVSNAEYLQFMEDGGYDRPELWLSDGWSTRQAEGWTAPPYWQHVDGMWTTVTLAGLQPLGHAEPVCHVSYYEADAFARWVRARLPTEAEWEKAASPQQVVGHFLEGGRLHPSAVPAAEDAGPFYQLFGDVWQWTASPYVGYPGYQPAAGALGEYNGKFMCNQLVLRGASCATPRSHARASYRNFFPASARWQFSGIRLAKDLS